MEAVDRELTAFYATAAVLPELLVTHPPCTYCGILQWSCTASGSNEAMNYLQAQVREASGSLLITARLYIECY